MLEVENFIQKYDNLFGYVGIFPEEAKTFNDKTLSQMEDIIKHNKKSLVLAKLDWIITGIRVLKICKKKYLLNKLNLQTK